MFVGRIMQKLPLFTKFGRKVAHGPRKKPVDFGGNLNHVILGLGFG